MVPVQVQMGAGAVTITIAEDASAVMTGPVAYSFSGRLPGDIGSTI